MEIVLRATFMFCFIWVVTRAIGKKELAEMSTFELILLVTFGDLIQQGVTQEDMSITGAMLAVGTIALLVVLTSFVGFRWSRSRGVIEGVPVLVIERGTILDEVIATERLTREEVISEAREQGIGDLAEVRFGVLEPDGSFSFVRYGDHDTRPPQATDEEGADA